MVAEFVGSRSCKIAMRSQRDWECSVPIYLEAEYDGWRERSGTFFCCDPDVFNSHRVFSMIRTSKCEDLFLVWSTENPNEILAIVDPLHRIVYPPYDRHDSSYYGEVEKIFASIKRHYGNDRVRLYRWDGGKGIAEEHL